MGAGLQRLLFFRKHFLVYIYRKYQSLKLLLKYQTWLCDFFIPETEIGTERMLFWHHWWYKKGLPFEVEK